MIKKSLLFLLLMTLFAPWAAKAQTELTVNDGTTTNNYIPVYGSYVDIQGAKSEFIIPAETTGMSALVGGTISKLTFYISGTPNTWGSPTIQVYMGEVTETTISAIHSPSDFTIVSTSVWSNQSSTIEVNLDTPFIYEGGNLLIGTYVQSESSTYKSTSFYGVSATSGSSRYYTNYGTGTAQSFLPKTTLTYTAGSGTLCKKPSGLEATLTPGNGTVATLNWTENGTATDWVLEYGTAPDFTGATSMTTGFTVSGTTVTANLTGLTAEAKYYARVKADCGGGSESAWSATCEFTPTNNLTLTLNDGTNTNSYIPIYGYYADATQRAEFIIPATNLASIDGATLNSMKFYANYNFTSTGTFQVYLKEVKDETFSGTTFYTADEATTVYTGTVTVSSTDGMTITFNSGFDYEGGNLLVGFYQATGGNYSSSSGDSFYGVTSSGSSISMYSSSSATQKNFLPKVTFAYSINPFKAPKNLAVSNVTNNSATVSWEVPASGTPTGYKYQYMPEGGSWTTLTSTTALSAPLTGLTANTNYTFQVQAIYSGGESGFVTTTFTTDCDSYPIPFSYGFEDVTDMNCWTVIDDPGRTVIDDGTSLGATAHEGANYFVFTYYDYPDTDPQYMTLITPELSGISDGLHVEFYYLTDGASSNPYPETFSVGYSTTDKNLSSFTWSNTLTNVVAVDYELFRANFPAGTKYIAVQHRSDDKDYLILDDFSFTEAPSCVEPSNLQVSNITTSGATLSWTIGGTATTWDIYVTEDVTDVPDDATTPTYAGVTTNTNYPISGLKPATTYYLYVRSACDATTHSDWTMPTSFNTECETMPLPFQYDFEDDALSVCWNTIGLNTGWITSGISSTAPQHGSKHYVITTSNYATGTQYLVLPEVDASYPVNEYEITFYSELAGSSTTGRTLAVGVMTDPNDASTFVQIGDAFTPATSYQQYKVRLNTYTGSGQYIAIKHNITSGPYSEAYTYIDNLEVSRIPSCIEPSDPTVSEITAHTAKLTWTGTSASYNIDYRTAAYTDGLSEEFSTTSAPSGWTRYSGALNTDGTGPTSTYSGGWSFGTNQFSSIHAYMNVYSTNKYWLVTPSVTIGNGYNMSFDVAYTAYNSTSAAGTTGTDDRFCVLISTDEKAHWTILREWNNAGTGDAVLNDIPVTFQTINDIDISSYKGQTVYFAFYGESTTSNADNTLRIDNVTIGTPVAEGTWQHTTSATTTKTLEGLLAQRKYEVKVQGDCGTEGTSEWSGIVNFTTDIPCPAPSGLAYNNLKSDHVDLSWTNAGAEDWVVAYKLSTDTDFTEVGVATADVTISGTTVTYTLTGLDPEKEYTVKVKDNCEASYPGDGTSEYTSTVTFTTLEACAQPTGLTASNIGHYTADLTWTGDSPEFIVKYRTAAAMNLDGIEEDFEDGTMPEGWTQSGPGSWVVNNGYGYNSIAAHGGTYNVRIGHSSNNNETYLITPMLDLSGQTGATMNFWYINNDYYGDIDEIHVYYRIDGGSWTELWSTDEDHSTWTESGDITLPNPSANYQVAFKMVDKWGRGVGLDDITIGHPTMNPAGSWQTLSPNPTTSTANLTGLTPGTKYDVTVAPSCNNTLVSDPATFTTVSENIKYFVTEGNWNVGTSWEPTGVPTILQDVELHANVTIPDGCVAEAKSITGTGTGTGTYTLTINDGGQLKHNNDNVLATVKKSITGYVAGNEENRAKYYLISSPLSQTMYAHTSSSTPNISSTGMLTGKYDFYKWSNENAYVGQEWRNYEKSTFYMTSGMYGYLYANENDVELTFTGNLQKSDTYKSLYAYNYVSATNTLGDWNLLGNPFACDAYLVTTSTGGTGLACYKMNAAGNGFEAIAAGSPIAPMQGFFYQATANGSVYMVRTEPAVTSTGNLNISLAQTVTTRGEQGDTDNAIVQFGEGNTLGKFSFREDAAKIYIPQDGKDYAVVNADAQGELPVYFKAYSNGNYTLSFTAQDVDFSYLHLIDNITGNDVDLLANSSYNFDARYTDYAARFRLVFCKGNANGDDNFGFISDGQLILTGLTGGETLQVIDALGRVITSTNAFNHISTENMAPGVYVLRLINGNDVKTQKIVVR